RILRAADMDDVRTPSPGNAEKSGQRERTLPHIDFGNGHGTGVMSQVVCEPAMRSAENKRLVSICAEPQGFANETILLSAEIRTAFGHQHLQLGYRRRERQTRHQWGIRSNTWVMRHCGLLRKNLRRAFPSLSF